MFKNVSKLWIVLYDFRSRKVLNVLQNVKFWKHLVASKAFLNKHDVDNGAKGLCMIMGASTFLLGRAENIMIDKKDPLDVEMNAVLSKSKTLIESGNLTEAEALLDKALEKTNRASSVWSNILLLLLGKINLKKGEYARSEGFYLQLVKNLAGFLETSLAVERLRLWTSIDLAQLYTETKKYKKAEEHFKYSLFTLEAMSVGAGDFQWAVETLHGVLDGYSELLTLAKRYDEALAQRKQAHNLCTTLYGERHIKLVRSYNEMGRIYTYKGRDDEAISCFSKAIEMCRLLAGVDPMELAALLVNSGRVHLRRGLLAMAKDHCEQAMTISGREKNQLGLAHARECLDGVKNAMK